MNVFVKTDLVIQFIVAVELIFIRDYLATAPCWPPGWTAAHTIGLTGSRIILQYVGNIICSVAALPILL